MRKGKVLIIETRYYGVVSTRVTCYSIGSEACVLLAGLSQPVIGVDRSSNSEVFRVTRVGVAIAVGVGMGLGVGVGLLVPGSLYRCHFTI
jgi:hypothetical protein